MYTLNSTEIHCVAYSIHSYNSEGALRSATPYAHEIETARTLDLITGNPDCNQGGVCVSRNNRPVNGKQSSRQLLRTGCIFRHVGNTV
jgi:hypothetical protein